MIRESTPRSVACHNDSLSEDFIDDGKKIWILDWEYGGIRDPYFDLGDFAVEHPSTGEREELKIKTNSGKPTEIHGAGQTVLGKFGNPCGFFLDRMTEICKLLTEER